MPNDTDVIDIEELKTKLADHKTWWQPCDHPTTELEDMVSTLAARVVADAKKLREVREALQELTETGNTASVAIARAALAKLGATS